ncbi:MAG: hypothetical protein WED34_15840 [Planctomycetales bacterium]
MRRPGSTACLLFSLLSLLSAAATGQEQPAPSEQPAAVAPAPGPTAPAASTEPAKSRPAEGGWPWDTIHLPNGRGQFVPVPVDADLREYLDWKARKHAPQPAARPGYGVTSVSLSGTAGDERAELNATIQVQVDRGDEWVQVPLRLNEAVLRETAHEGPGPAGFDEFDRDAGYRWSLKGAGLHTLRLSLFVPVRKQSPMRRLQLALPATAVSHAKISVPMKRLTVKAGDPLLERDARSTIRTRVLPDDATEIEVFGLDQRLDLTWQPLPDPTQVATVLESHTSIVVKPAIDSVLLEAAQTVQARQGSFDGLTVRLPPGFELIVVEGRQYASHETAADGRIAVKLAEPGTGPIELRWTLQAPLPESGELHLEGFEVEHARRQTGDVALALVEGLRISRLEAENVHRINVSIMIGQPPLASAYRFLKQPFRLGVAVTRDPPGYSVQPEQRLRFTGERVELTAEFKVRVYRGVVETLDLIWPNRRAEGWAIDPPDLFDPSLDAAAIERFEFATDETSDLVRVHLRDRQPGEFTLRLRAGRKLLAEPEAAVITLPGIDTPTPSPADLLVTAADAVEVQLEPTGETSLERVDPAGAGAGPEGAAHYRVPALAPMLAVRLSIHEQIVQTTGQVAVEIADDRLLVRERIAYDVRYERLPQVRLTVPRALGEQVRFLNVPDGAVLTPSWTDRGDPDSRQAVIRFAEPRIGRFEIAAEYSVDLGVALPPAETAESALPLVLPAEAPFGALVFSAPPIESVEVSVNGNDGGAAWVPQMTADDRRQWQTAGPAREISLRLQRSTPDLPQHYVVRRCLLRTAFDYDGAAASRAQFRLEGEFTRLLLHLPEGQTVQALWWDQRPIELDRLVEVDSNSGMHRLEIADVAAGPVSGEHLLTLDFQSRGSGRSSGTEWGEAHQVRIPSFPANVRVDQSAAEIVLPIDQHLFSQPAGLTPLYDWRRQAVFWTRHVRAGYADLDEWIGAADGPPADPIFDAGNSYVFARFGPVAAFQFQAMSQSWIVLLGAGLSLAAGFVLLKVPATRDALTLLIIAFGGALAGLWYAEPVRVLLQPALLGLVLALAAAAIEQAIQRRRAPSIITLSTPSDFYSPAPGGSGNYRALPAGADERTAVRPGPGHSAEPVSTTSTGRER